MKKYLDILKEQTSRQTKRKFSLRELFVQMPEIRELSGVERDKAMLRLGIVAELDAVNLYEEMAALCESEDARDVFLSVANEEKAHVGEFEFLLEHFDEDHEKYENEGEEEAKDITGLPDHPNEEE